MYCPELLPIDPLLISATCHVVPLPLVVVPEPLPEPLPEPPPEPLAALELYWKVMSVMASSMKRSAPSTLAVKLLAPEPPVPITDDSSSKESLPVLGLFIRSKYPTWVMIIIIIIKNADLTVLPLLTLRCIVFDYPIRLLYTTPFMKGYRLANQAESYMLITVSSRLASSSSSALFFLSMLTSLSSS